MKWNNSQFDPRPDEHQEVYVSVRGVYYITIYDNKKSVFRLRDAPETYFDPVAEHFYWVDYSANNDGSIASAYTKLRPEELTSKHSFLTEHNGLQYRCYLDENGRVCVLDKEGKNRLVSAPSGISRIEDAKDTAARMIESLTIKKK